MKFLWLIIPVLLAGQIEAQFDESSIGGKIGFNLGHFTGEDSDLDNTDTKLRPGINVGAFANIALHEIFSLQPEIQYTQKGETVEAGNDLVSGSWNIQLSYLEIPLLAKVAFPVEARTRPYVYAGPFLGINLQSETDEIYEVGPFNFDAGTDLDEDVNQVESGVVTGVGFSHDLDKFLMFLDFRYTIGLTKTFDDDIFDDVFTGTLAGQLGFGFKL
ncbi:MAG: outer membrane beta-barrel protein [Chitinivibrionales bacterium]|nr:outer membrane beta-barrel protein [Chitinivibrionales bacterium]